MNAPLLTYDEAAKLLQVSSWTVRRWVARKKLKCVHLSGTTKRIRSSDLARMIEQRVS